MTQKSITNIQKEYSVSAADATGHIPQTEITVRRGQTVDTQHANVCSTCDHNGSVQRPEIL